jgi:hypothetical protein
MSVTVRQYTRQLQSDKVFFYKEIIENISYSQPHELISNGYQLPGDFSIITEEGQQVFLKDVINAPILVYRFSEAQCSDCVEQQFKLFRSEKHNIPQNIILWGSYSNVRKIKIIKNTFDVDFKSYNVDKIDISLDKFLNPFFFIITPDLTCHSFFTAIKENPAMTMLYLTTMKTKLEDNIN